MADAFVFSRSGRTARTFVILVFVYAALIGATRMIDASPWLMAGLALLTLPALWDLWHNPSAGLRLSKDRIDWHSGRRTGSLELREIDYMRFDTRWDFSVRITVILKNDTRVRLPYEATPPHLDFENALNLHGIDVKRHHFTVF